MVDFVNRCPLFDPLYIYPPLLDAAARIVGSRSSSLTETRERFGQARQCWTSRRRGTRCNRLAALGFILMIDAFGPDNGATRFIPGSHRWGDPPRMVVCRRTPRKWMSAHGPAGSLLCSMINVARPGRQPLHRPRRSRRARSFREGGRASTDFGRRMSSETRARLVPSRITFWQSRTPATDSPAAWGAEWSGRSVREAVANPLRDCSRLIRLQGRRRPLRWFDSAAACDARPNGRRLRLHLTA